MDPSPATTSLARLEFDGSAVPRPDPDVEPAGYMVEADDGTRLHFLDWGRPAAGVARAGWPARSREATDRSAAGESILGVLLVHGIAQTGWAWAPIARRLAGIAHVVAPDLRGHGLSDAPQGGYDLATLAGDVLAVAEGAGLRAAAPGPLGADPGETRPPGSRLVVAGHGFGAVVAAACAVVLGAGCAGLVLVDGGWDDSDRIAGTTLDEWLASIEEPPEVLRTMAAFLDDRAAYDPATWDGDQERAARASVVELPAGRVVSSARRHAVEGAGATLLAYDPAPTLAAVEAPIVALAARDEEDGRRMAALVRAGAAIVAAGRRPPRVSLFPADGHNLMRYRPDDVAGAILALT